MQQWEHKSSSCDAGKLRCIMKLNAGCWRVLLSQLHIVFTYKNMTKFWSICVLSTERAHAHQKHMHTHKQNERLWCLHPRKAYLIFKNAQSQLRAFEALKPSSVPLFLPSHHLHFPSVTFSFRASSLQKKEARMKLLWDGRDVRINHYHSPTVATLCLLVYN